MLKTIYLETTTTCNLRCTMCPRLGQEAVSSLPALMPSEIFYRTQAVFSPGKTIALVGCGEPTTDSRLLDFVKIANTAGMYTMFTTNGMWLDEFLAERILSSGLQMLGVSIDGAKAETFESIRCGARFIQVLDNLKNFLFLRHRYGDRPVVKIQIVLMKSNIRELADLVEIAADMGVEEVYGKNLCFVRTHDLQNQSLQPAYNPAVDCELRDNAINQALSVARKRGMRLVVPSYEKHGANTCPYHPEESVFIRRNGDVYPCPVYAVWNDGLDPEVINSKRLGNVLLHELSQIWESQNACKFREHFSAGNDSYCLTCTVWQQGYQVASPIYIPGYTY